MDAIMSMNTSLNKKVYHSALQDMKHGSCFTGATLIEVGVYYVTRICLVRNRVRRFPFVRTDRQDHSCRDENFTFN